MGIKIIKAASGTAPALVSPGLRPPHLLPGNVEKILSLYQRSIDSKRTVCLFQEAEAASKSIAYIHALLNDFKNPRISDHFLFHAFPSELIAGIELALSQATPEKNSSEVFKKTPRILLQLKNGSGENILEAFLANRAQKLLALRDQAYLHQLHDVITALDISDHFATQDRLKERASSLFSSLSLSTQNKLKTIPYKSKSVIKDTITLLEKQNPHSFQFSFSHFLTDTFQQGEQPEICGEVLKLQQLQNFHTLLKSKQDRASIFKKYKELDPELKTALGKALWAACYRPEEDFFADKLIEKNPQILLECQSKERVLVIDQMIAFYRTKLTLYRHKTVFHQFRQNFKKAENEEQRKKLFDSLPEHSKNDLINILCSLQKDKEFASNLSILLADEPTSVLDYYSSRLNQKLALSIQQGIDQFAKEMIIPSDPIDCSSTRLSSGSLTDLQVPIAMISAEFAGVISTGGLAPAVEGMARSYSEKKTRVILPLYDVINSNIPLTEKEKYAITLHGKIHRIFKAKIKGIKCYFIEDKENFTIGRDAKGNPNKIYDGPSDAAVKRRWAHFQSAAAELAHKLSTKPKNPVQLIHCHDAQTGLIPRLLIARHFDEWKQGLTPATVFTFHNNSTPLFYDHKHGQKILQEIGLPPDSLCSFVEGLEASDMNTTVSETFAQESQTQVHGKGVDRYVHINAFKEKLVGIVNGNTIGFDPRTDPVLKNWHTCDGQTLDLTYGPNDADLPEKKRLIRQQLIDYLHSHHLAELDPTKPIFLYVGRYDVYQKGIDKLPIIMDEVLKNGGQFLCIGVEPDEKADAILSQMQAQAETLSHKGVCIIRDYRRPDGRLYWQQGNSAQDQSGVQGFGSILRAAVDVGVLPSLFEPCGLVQKELHAFGIPTLATATGGLNDTIFTSGPHRNGYLFKRLPEWESEEQNVLIREIVEQAVIEAQIALNALYQENDPELKPFIDQMKKIMSNGLQSSWVSTFDGSLSPIDRLKQVYVKALQNRSSRGKIYLDAHVTRFDESEKSWF